jgi:DNA replication protein DnaC
MDTKSWSFPIQQYKSLIQKLKTKKDFSIEKDLSEKEINNIQVVIIDEDNFFI